MSELVVGDKVSYALEGGGYPSSFGEGVVVGWMPYAPKDVVLLAGNNADGTSYSGMPINKQHCKKISSGHNEFAEKAAKYYAAKYKVKLL